MRQVKMVWILRGNYDQGTGGARKFPGRSQGVGDQVIETWLKSEIKSEKCFRLSLNPIVAF